MNRQFSAGNFHIALASVVCVFVAAVDFDAARFISGNIIIGLNGQLAAAHFKAVIRFNTKALLFITIYLGSLGTVQFNVDGSRFYGNHVIRDDAVLISGNHRK